MITMSIIGILLAIYCIYRSWKFMTNDKDETIVPVIWCFMMGAGISLLLLIMWLIDLGIKYLP